MTYFSLRCRDRCRPVSHVGTAQWQYVLPNRRRSNRGVGEAFEQQVKIIASDMVGGRWSALRQRSSSTAKLRPFANSYPEAWATHVICSPPYANNYDYADATRLEQTMLGEIKGWGPEAGPAEIFFDLALNI